MYEQALAGWAEVRPKDGQWAVYTRVIFEDGVREAYINTFFYESLAKRAADWITRAMNRTDLRARGPIDY